MGCVVSHPNVENSEPVAHTPKPNLLNAGAPESAKTAPGDATTAAPATEAGTDPKTNADVPTTSKPAGTTVNQQQLAIDYGKVKLILRGLFKGFIDEALPHFDNLFENSTEVIAAFGEAVEDIQLGGWDNFVSGMAKAATALEMLLNALNDLDIAAAQLEDLTRVIAIFRNPSLIVGHVTGEITVNGAHIWELINNAIQAWQEGRYEDFGNHIGTAIAEVLTVEENVTPWWTGCPSVGCGSFPTNCNCWGQ